MKQKFYIHETGNGYIYDKRIFWGVIAIVLVLVFFVSKDYNFNFKTNFYFKCEDYSCKNPIMNKQTRAYNTYTDADLKKDCIADWCSQEFLPRGEYGIKPPDSFIFKNLPLISFGLVILALVINHIIHNKGKKPGIKLNLSDKWLSKINKLGKKLGDKFGELEENEEE